MIQVVHPGSVSRIRILDPDPDFLPIPDPGSATLELPTECTKKLRSLQYSKTECSIFTFEFYLLKSSFKMLSMYLVRIYKSRQKMEKFVMLNQ
jgi:hypothetical protein